MITNTGQADLFSSENKSFQCLLDWLQEGSKILKLKPHEITGCVICGMRRPLTSSILGRVRLVAANPREELCINQI